MFKRLSFAVVLLLVPLGCQQPTANIRAVINISSALLVDYEYIGVDAIQGEETFVGVEVEPGVLRLEVPAGVPTTIRALLIDAEDYTSLLAYEGSTDITPVAGEQSIDIAATATTSAQVVVQPRFDDGRDWTQPFALTATDDSTGTAVALEANVLFELATDRPITISGVHPRDSGVIVSGTATVTSGSAEVVIDMGPPPPTLVATLVKIGDSEGVGFENLVVGAGYEGDVQCVFLDACSNPPACCLAIDPAAWVNCDQALASPPNQFLEGEYYLALRYANVSDSCGIVAAEFDRTPPTVEVLFSPSFLEPGATINPTMTISGSEALNPAALLVTLNLQTTNLCPAPIPGGSELECIDMALTGSGRNELLAITVSGEDLAGNPFLVVAPYHDLSGVTPPTGPAVIVSGAQTVPQVPNPTLYEIPIWIELTNIGDMDACGVAVSSITVTRVDGQPASINAYPDPKRLTLTAGGGTERYWALLQPQSPPPPPPGEYIADMQLTWDACPASVGTIPTVQVRFRIDIPPARWLTNGSLAIAALPPEFGGHRLPLVGGYSTEDPVWAFDTSDTAVLTFDYSNSSEASPQGLGPATVTLTNYSPYKDPAPTLTQANCAPSPNDCIWISLDSTCGCAERDAVLVDVLEAPKLLVLRGGTTPSLHRVAATEFPGTTVGDVGTTIDAGIGTPFKLLWESVSGSVVVVGDAGVQIFSDTTATATSTVVTNPCNLNTAGGETILDGTITGSGAGHSRPVPDIALLLDIGGPVHCEINAVDGTDQPPTGFALTNGTAGECIAEKLVGDPVTGEFTAMGNDRPGARSASRCAHSYTTRNNQLDDIVPYPIGASVGFTQPVLDIAYDPFGNYAALLVDRTQAAADHDVTGWGLGAMLEGVMPTDLVSCTMSIGTPDAVVIDLVTQEVYVAISNDGISDCFGTAGLIHRVLRRFPARTGVSLVPVDVSTRIEAAVVRTTALAIDHANRLLYVGDDQGRILAQRLNSLGVLNDRLAEPGATLPSPGPAIIDVLVAGPQPISPSVTVAEPGQVMTINGVGFSGSSDTVYVQGLPVTPLYVTPTAITFEVPWELEALESLLYDAKITVASRGVMSGPIYTIVSVTPKPAGSTVRFSHPLRPSGCFMSPCTFSRLVEGPDSRPFKSSNLGFTVVDNWKTGNAPPSPIMSGTPEALVAAHASVRMIGHLNDRWWTSRLYYDVPTFQYILEQPLTSSQVGTGGSPILAVSDDQQLAAIAYAGSSDATLYWGTSLNPHPAGFFTSLFTGAETIGAMAFDRSGTALIAAGTDGSIAVVDLAVTPIAVVTPTIDTSAGCPVTSPSTTMIELSRYGTDDELTLVTTNGADLAVWLIDYDVGWRQHCRSVATGAVIAGATSFMAAVSPFGTPIAIAQWSLTAWDLQLLDRNELDGVNTRASLPLTFAPLDMMFSITGQQLHLVGADNDRSYDLVDLPYWPF